MGFIDGLQNTYGFMSPECRNALKKVLQPPPLGYDNFLRGILGHKAKRIPLDGMIYYPSSKLLSLYLWFFWILLFVSAYIFGIILVRTFERQNTQQRAHIHGLFCRLYYIIETVANTLHRTGSRQIITPPTWVPNPVARQTPSIFVTSLEYAPIATSLKRRLTPFRDKERRGSSTEGEWLPSGPCAMDATSGNVDTEDLGQKEQRVLSDTAYSCKGCGEILPEGTAFELAGNRWHINCFRCNTCYTMLKSDAIKILLLGDGSPICENCGYSLPHPKLERHLGRHLEELALFALPRTDAEEDLDSNESSHQSSRASETPAEIQNKQAISPLSTGQATNSRAGSENNRLQDDDDQADSRSVSGSSRSKSQSRDMTPANIGILDADPVLESEMTAREKKKIAMAEKTFQKLEQGRNVQKKRKRTSGGSTLNTPSGGSSHHPGQVSLSVPNTPSVGRPLASYADVGTSNHPSPHDSIHEQPFDIARSPPNPATKSTLTH
jgi:LIM domain